MKNFYIVLTLLGFVMGSINTGVAAETLTTDDLIGMLQNKASAPTETLTQEELERRQQNRITVERAGSGKDITVEERKKLADIVKENSSPSIDMEIYFAYNSSAISPSSVPTLIKLGRAFSDFRLSKGTFMIAGHTDAKGSDNYNQQLSQRRARSVKRFLIENFDINSRKLIAIGYGEEQLKNRYDPFAEENRRVQVVNLGGVVTGH